MMIFMKNKDNLEDYHVHIYPVKTMYELDVKAKSPDEARGKALKILKDFNVEEVVSDNSHIVVDFKGK